MSFKLMDNAKYNTFQHDTNSASGTFTVGDGVEATGPGRFQYTILAICGFIWMMDAMELMIFSLLGPILECEWNISHIQQAALTTVMLLGMSVGAPVTGFLSDVHGRKTVILITVIFAAYFGILSAFSPSYIWIMTLRTLTGFFLAGVPQAVVYVSELLPVSIRGKTIPPMTALFGLGSMITVVFAMLTVNHIGWRWWMLLCSLPFCIIIPFVVWLPESPRYNMLRGRREEALVVLERIAQINNKTLPVGHLKHEDIVDQGNIRDLLSVDVRRRFIQLALSWFLFLFLYYGTVLYTTELIRWHTDCQPPGVTVAGPAVACLADCKHLSTTDYLLILVTTIGDLAVAPVVVVCVEVIGRRATLSLSMLIHTISAISLIFCLPRVLLVISLSLARSSIAMTGQTLHLYQSEVYPTRVRALGVGLGYSASRFGGLASPLFAQVLIYESRLVGIGVYAVVAFVAFINFINLPIETKGQRLEATAGDT